MVSNTNVREASLVLLQVTQLTRLIGDIPLVPYPMAHFGQPETGFQYHASQSMDQGVLMQTVFSGHTMCGNTVVSPSAVPFAYFQSQGFPTQPHPYLGYQQYHPPEGHDGLFSASPMRGSRSTREGISPERGVPRSVSRCAIYLRVPTHLMTNISALLSGVSDPHLSTEVCGYSVCKHAGIDLMSLRTNFQVNTHLRSN